MPDYIPIRDQNKIEIQSDAKKISLKASGLDFFMLFDLDVFAFSLISIIYDYTHLLTWLVLAILTFIFAVFAIKRFHLSKIKILITLVFITLIASQYISNINNFKVLEIHSNFGDHLNSKFIRYSILAVPFEDLNYNLDLKSRIVNLPVSNKNKTLITSVAGPSNLIYAKNLKIYTENTLLDKNSRLMPYRQQLVAKYQSSGYGGLDFNFKIRNSKYVSLNINSEVGDKRGFYYPVLRNHIVFPKIDQSSVSNFEYSLNVYTQLKSIKFIEFTLLYLCLVLFFHSIKLIKSVK
jgi:hypothetical protein